MSDTGPSEFETVLELGAADRPNPAPEMEWGPALMSSVVTSSELQALTLQARAPLLGNWFCEGDLGLIYAPRGVGKTWHAMQFAAALSQENGRVGPWVSNGRTNVLYVDGEMPPDLIRDRDRGLGDGEGEVRYLNHDILFNRTGRVMNIAKIEFQQEITRYCLDNNIKVLFLDNISTLASGIKENDADEWEPISNWLLQLRRHKIAVVLIHHAGRNGLARGTSKREDAAFWVIVLEDAKQDAEDKRGARFVARFTKPSRNTSDEVPAVEWHIVTDMASGEIQIGYKTACPLSLFRQLIEAGFTSCGEIAQEMKVSKSTVSRLAKRAMQEGWLARTNSQKYELTTEEPNPLD